MPGGKTAGSWPPRWVTPAAERVSDGPDVGEFIEAYCTITKDSIAGRRGEPIVLRDWQSQLLRSLFVRRADGRRKHRQALIGMPRKNGKSAIGAGIALYGLFCEADGAEVYSCAGDREQARIVFAMARRMVEANPELADSSKLFRDAIEVPSTGSVYRCLSAEAYTKEGLSPTLVCFDEVHVQPNDEFWNVMALGSGARVDPLIMGITTAGSRTDSLGRDTLCYRMYQHGQKVARGEIVDPSFFFAWWEPKTGAKADHKSPEVWAESNPGFDDLIDAEDFASVLMRTPEAEYRTKRTNVFVTSAESALPHGAWDRLAEPDRVPPPETPQVLFFDGSWAGDCTGIIALSVEERPHMWVVDVWENPHDGTEWRVPVTDVEDRIRSEAKTRTTLEVDCDPFRWQRSISVLSDEGLPMIEWPTSSLARMVPAWKRFYDAVLDRTFTHSGDPRLARHVENMRLKIDAKGARPVKEHKASERHIDLGICAVGGLDRAMWNIENLAVPSDADFYTI